MQQLLKEYRAAHKKRLAKAGLLIDDVLEKGQNPRALFIACSDSRVDPALILQCKPGDIFVIRNVANLVPPYDADKHHHGTSAALEFGICYLNIPKIIILGHSNCGGVTAHMTQHIPQDDFLSAWLKIMPAFEGVDVNNCAKESLIQSGKNLQTFPWIKNRLDSGNLEIHLWFFNIADGIIEAYDRDRDMFGTLV